MNKATEKTENPQAGPVRSKKGRRVRIFMIILLIVLLAGHIILNPEGPTKMGLMPTPVVYQDDRVEPLWNPSIEKETTDIRVFYATDRKPSGSKDNRTYSHRPAHCIRLGESFLRFGEEDLSWQQLRELTFTDTRSLEIPVYLEQVREYGPLTSTVDPKHSQKNPELLDTSGQERFLEKINETLAASRKKKINIYVHGSIVNFYHPMAVSAGLYHYLAREGVMIAYAWRTRPGIWHYPGDVKRAEESVPYLTELIEFLTANTDAESFNLISYSAGGPLLINALIKLREANPELDADELSKKYRIGTVIFASSDVDLKTFSSDLLPRLYDLPSEIVVTVNENDGTLASSQWMYGASRLGKPDIQDLTREDLDLLARTAEGKLTAIDAGHAIHERTGGQLKGHDYWYMNDWVSSEILASLAWSLPPSNRGLALKEGKKSYYFPPDYPERIVDFVLDRFEITENTNSK